MMTGARIILDTGMDAVRDGLADLAGASWIMSLPQRQAAYRGHPAGRARPGLAAGGGARLVVVTFGQTANPAPDRMVLPVRWEPVEPGDELTVELNGSITLDPAATRERSALTLAGFCQAASGVLASDGRQRAGPELTEASQDFIIDVARDITRAAGLGPERDLLGPTWAW
jgi:hypothetical protein